MYQQLRDYAWNYLTRKERLEEVLQDTFWSIYVNMEIVMKEENYYSWIFECFKNNLKEAIQKEIVSRRTEVSYEAILDENISDGFDFTKQVEDRELLNQIAKKEELQSLYLQYVEGYSIAEMTKILNMTEGQYKMRICRLKKKLAKNLEEIGYESPKKKKK